MVKSNSHEAPYRTFRIPLFLRYPNQWKIATYYLRDSSEGFEYVTKVV